MIYAYLDKNVKANNMKELTSKVEGVSYKELNYDDLIIPNDATAIAVHGVLRGNDTLIKRAVEKDIPWIMMDNGYLGKYKRVITNATAPTTFRSGRRFEHGTKLEQWRGGIGQHILVLPPSPPYMDTFGIRDFLNHIAHNANIYTDLPLVMRAKPAKGKKAPPLAEQLADAYAVITWGSAIAIEASRLGIPTISLGWCPAKHVSYQLEDLHTNKMTQEPDRMGMLDNLTWSSFDRAELPSAWNIMKENAKCPLI